LLSGELLPLISNFPYSATYLFSIPAPIFGTLFVLMLLTGKYFGLSLPLFLLLVLVSSAIVLFFHRITRSRTMVWKFSITYASRGAIGVSSTIFLALAMVWLTPQLP
jgi:hypothetical protein